MHRDCLFGAAGVVALMTAHRTSMLSGAKPESLQHEIIRIALELDQNLNQPADLGENPTESGAATRS